MIYTIITISVLILFWKKIRLFFNYIGYIFDIENQVHTKFSDGTDELKYGDKVNIKYSRFRKEFYIVINNCYILKGFMCNQTRAFHYNSYTYYESFETIEVKEIY